jgi:N-methylhydantoinase B/oxoprolinase/acetone carboxylase alpha subunit
MDNSSRVDPITFEVIKNSLEHICRQMGTVLRKTSYSPILYDMVDFSNALLDGQGELIGQAENCPAHLGAMHFSTKAAVNEIGLDNLNDGDIIISNNPFKGGTHVPDITFIMPIFYQGEATGFVCSRGHWTDLGGAAAGLSASSQHLVEDGLVIDPTKIFDSGKPVDAVINLIKTNTRVPHYIDGDINAHRGALMAGLAGVKGLIERYGKDVYDHSVAQLMKYVEKRTRNAIRKIPDGQYHGAEDLDCDGYSEKSVHIEVTLTVEGSDIKVDFTGTGPISKGTVNSPRANTYSAVYFALKFFLDPTCPTNAGYYTPIHILLPEDTWVNAKWPASTRLCTTAAGETIADVIWKALSQAIPEQVNASNYGANVHYIGGTNSKTGQYFVFGDLSPGGWGATPRNDGMNARYNRNGNCMDLTPEIAELFFPVRCLRRELIADSGGAGKHRGGLGTRQTWEITDSDNAAVSQMMTRTKSGPPGLNGGHSGRSGRSFLNYGENDQRIIGGRTPENSWQMSLFSNFQLKRGDAYTAECPGGGGWGDPVDRDPEAVLDDVRDGFVTAQSAQREYGVIFYDEGDRVDYAATKELRRKIRAAK